MNKNSFLSKLMAKPTSVDAWVLSVFVLFITWHPLYLHGPLNLFEWGLYLPGIDAIRHGQIPFRDFFYLRGPFELYMPAFLMDFFGDQVAVLSTYFYVGTILLFIVAAILACLLVPNRFILYCAIPVMVARTFPRVVFTYWGGMRFVFGLLGVYFLVRFCQSRKKGWLVGAGILTAIALLTSAEIGICLGFAFVGTLIFQKLLGEQWKKIGTSLLWYGVSFLIIVLPYVLYLYAHAALKDFIVDTATVASRLRATYIQVEIVPHNAHEFFKALTTPKNTNFKQLTPIYCYLIFFGYILARLRRRCCDSLDQAAVAVALYGVMIYVLAFRSLWASQFEMALMPAKIILFFLLARAVMFIQSRVQWTEQLRTTLSLVFLLAVFATSIPYAISRFEKRFFVFKLKGQWIDPPEVPRLKGSYISPLQSRDITMLKSFLDKNTVAGERVFMFPEMGAISYIVDRPPVGRFGMVILAWLKDDWHNELIADLKQHPSHFVVLQKKMPDDFQTSYFPVAANLHKFQETMGFISQNYTPIFETPSYQVLRYNQS